MIVLYRIMMMFVGYMLACIAAALVLTIATLTPGRLEWNEFFATFGINSPHAQSTALWIVVALGAFVVFVIGLLPVLLVIALAEGFAIRSIVLYGALGGALMLAMIYGLDFAGFVAPVVGDVAREREVFAAAGIAGGLVYWLCAGRNAGVWK